jgi:hypothetical protein
MSDLGSDPRQPAAEKPGSSAKVLYRRLISEELPEEERQRLEELVFEDHHLFEELLAEEDELVDALAEGEAAPDVTELTSRRPAVIPRLEQRIAFARAMRAAAARQPEGAQARPRRRAVSRWLAVAALLASVALVTWLAQSVFRSPTSVPAFVLAAGGHRGPASPVLQVPPGAEAVDLLLEIQARDAAGLFEARLRQSSDHELWRRSGLSAERHPWGMAVRLRVPSRDLREGAYEVVLTTRGEGSPPRDIGWYVFKVVTSRRP